MIPRMDHGPSPNDPPDDPMDHPPDDPMDHPPDDPMDHPPDDPMDHPPDDPMDHPPNDPMDHPPNDPMDHPPNDPMDHPPDDPMDHPPNDPMDHPPNDPMDHPQICGPPLPPGSISGDIYPPIPQDSCLWWSREDALMTIINNKQVFVLTSSCYLMYNVGFEQSKFGSFTG